MTRFPPLLLLLILLLPWQGLAAPKIVATIKPIQALISGVTEGITEPDLLVTKNASPHTYTMRPSDMKTLQQADIIFMVSRDFETFLVKPLESARSAAVIELMNADGIKKLPLRTERIWGDAHEAKHDHEHSSKFDTHIWLDPANAIAIVIAAAETLSKKDPAHAAAYRKNAAAMMLEIKQLDQEISSKLAPYSDVPYLVAHDAYHYFENRYHLRAVGAITLNPDQPPGAKTLKALQESISRHNAVCLFSEPQFPQSFIQLIAESTGVGTGVLDPEWGANDTDKGKNAYFSLMQRLTSNLIECFDKKRSLMS